MLPAPAAVWSRWRAVIAPGTGAAERGDAVVAVVLALVAAVWPLLLLDLPALLDLPNNLARAAIATRLGHDPFYDALYVASPPSVPNAAFDLFLGVVRPWLAPASSARVFAVLAILATVTGAIALARALRGNVALVALFAALTAHNYSTTWGFLNYQIGVGCFLWASALWLSSSPRGRGALGALLWSPAIAVVLFYCHAIPLVLYGLVVLGSEVHAWLAAADGIGARLRRVALAAAQFALPALIVACSPTTGELTGASWPDLVANLRGCAKAFHAGLGAADYLHLVVLAVGLVAAAAAGRLRLKAPMRWPVVMLAAVCLLAPDKTSEAACLQQRLPGAVALAGLAGVAWQPHHRGLGRAVLGFLAAALLVRTALLTSAHRERAAMLADAAAVLAVVPEQAVLATASGPAAAEDGWEKYRAPLQHAACLRAMAGRVFLPQLLVSTLHHTVAPASATVAEANAMSGLQLPVRTPDELRHQVEDLATLLRAGRDAGECPPLRGGVWLAAVHFPDGFAFPSDLVEVVAETPELAVLRVR